MLDYKEYSKTNFKSEIQDLRNQIYRLEVMASLSFELSMMLESYEKNNSQILKHISTNTNGECFYFFKDLTNEENDILFQMLKDAYLKQDKITRHNTTLFVTFDSNKIITLVSSIYRDVTIIPNENDISKLC